MHEEIPVNRVVLSPFREDELTHFWTQPEGVVNLDNINEFLLCISHNKNYVVDENWFFNVTVEVDKVTCPECLEWLHA